MDIELQLPWHKEQWRRIVQQLSTKSLPHAFLFEGHAGVGKSHFVKQFSRLVLCEKSALGPDSSTNKLAEHDHLQACGICKQCKLFDSDSHPDFKTISPEESASKIKVDQVRQLVDFFGQSSLQGGRKISVISPAEALNLNSANALLKTLEEPSADSVLILVSHQPGLLLPTIKSRCQVVHFNSPSVAESISWLQQQTGEMSLDKTLSEADLSEVLALAQFAPLKAFDYLQNDALEEHRTMLDELAAFLKNEFVSSTLATRWNDDNAVLRLAWMMAWVETILKMKLSHDLANEAPAQKMFMYLSEKSSNTELFDLYDTCLQQFKLFQGSSNPNKVLSFELLLHKWSGLMRKTKPDGR